MKIHFKACLAIGIALVLTQAVSAQVPLKGEEYAPIRDALESSEDIRIFNDHLVFLSDPFLGGRLPGTPGMELAKDYMEHYFKLSGLEPPFESVTSEDGQEVVRPFSSFRQPFELGGRRNVTQSEFSFGDTILEKGKDFDVPGYSSPGSIEAPVVFCGYSIQNEDKGYMSYGDDVDLSGKVAFILRHEPMSEEGTSLWVDEQSRGRWSRSASFERKINAALERKAEAIILCNVPGAKDPRAQILRARGRQKDVPVFTMSSEMGDKFVKEADGRSLMDLRRLADESGGVIPFNKTVKMSCEIERKSIVAENVGGLIRGKGKLSGELIIVGAHLDHLGNGEFGSRRGSGKLHPGADDNASGSAGIMLMADKLAKMYKELPEDADARSILFIGFTAEESGLNGSRHYVKEPMVPLDRHYCMINFDMVGRIINKRLSVSGGNSAEGFADWLKPFYEKSGLDIQESDSMAGSDHIPFYQSKIPVLFGIIADFHDDYHTPDDVSWKINRVDAVKSMNLFKDIAFALAQRAEALPFKESPRGQRGGNRTTRSSIKVRFGIRPGSYDEETKGILVDNVTPDMPAAKAGIVSGDLIVKWEGEKVENVRSWMEMLGKHKPGDEVAIGIVRDGKEMEVKATLVGSGG